MLNDIRHIQYIVTPKNTVTVNLLIINTLPLPMIEAEHLPFNPSQLCSD